MADDIAAETLPESSTDHPETASITLTYHGAPHTFSLPTTATITDLSDHIASTLSIPATNQKFLISKLGLLKPPFKDPSLALSTLHDKKISLLGSTAAEVSSLTQHHLTTSHRHRPTVAPLPRVKAYKTHDPASDGLYTFTTLLPLPYLPNPSRSLALLQRLKSDPGIRAVMRAHKWTVPLLTEMNPADHTSSDHAGGTSRTLGLNRNAGEVIELRLRTDAYDGYRDYKTIRKTLCHELAHNVHGPHDKDFWELCRRVEREVEAGDWRSGGRRVGEEEFYQPEGGDGGGHEGEEVHDHGGWEGGEYVLGGAAPGGGAEEGESGSGTAAQGQGLSRREILARAAEERIKRLREQQQQQSGDHEDGGDGASGSG